MNYDQPARRFPTILQASLVFVFSLLIFSPPVFASGLQLSGNQSELALAPYLQGYEDETAAMTVEEIDKIDKFVPLSPHLSHPGFTKSAIWFRLDVTNTSALPLVRWISLQPVRLQEASLFFRQGGRWQRLDTGTGKPFALHPVDAANAVLPFNLAPGQSVTLYLRVAGTNSFYIDAALWEPLAFRKHASNLRLFDGLLLGALMLTAFYGLLMFVTLEYPAFLLHAFTTLAYSAYEASLRGYGFMYLWPDATEWATGSLAFFSTLAAIGLLLFIRSLMAMPEKMPFWNRLLQAVLCGHVLVALGELFGDYRTWASLATILNTASVALAVIAGLVARKQNFPASRFYLAAFATALMGNLVRLQSIFGFTGTASYGEFITPLSVLIANIFLLAAVVDRIALARKEKEIAQQALVELHATHNAQLEQAVQERTVDLNVALQEARTANKARNQMLAYISHDLRAPLMSIMHYTHLLLTNGEGSAARYCATVEQNVAYQLELIDDLTEYARGELEQLKLELGPTYLYSFLYGIAAQGELLALHRGNRFALDLHDDLPAVAVFDVKRLKQVLMNLLSNAAKFTAGGEIRLQVQFIDGGLVRFAVVDDGPGISDEERENIFLPYERGQSERAGIGLGLTIASRIVHKMGGEIKVESSPGKGARFWFEIALATAQEDDVPMQVAAFAMPDAFGTAKRILLVDGNSAMQDFLAEIVSLADFDVLKAGGMDEAEKMFPEVSCDAILVTHGGPQQDVWRLLERLHFLSFGNPPPIVYYSAAPCRRPAGFPPDMDFGAMLLKPVAVDGLLEVLRQVLLPKQAIAHN